MAKTVAIGIQSFEKLREENYFYIDKTDFIREWWENGDAVTGNDRAFYQRVNAEMDDVDASMSAHYLAKFLKQYYGKNAIVILDEYDAPMQEAYVHGYWDELVSFTRNLFNSTFKTNPSLERGIMTGITQVSKESIFRI